MGETRSTDGALIRWRETGSGPPLVVVHGGRPTPLVWPPAAALSGLVRVVAVGRRGYGFSEDRPLYSHRQEYEDVAAVVDAVGPPAWLFGSSSGAICALGAAQLLDVEKLVLFEPPLPVDGPLFGPYLAEMEQAIARGDPEHAIVVGLRHGVHLDERQIAHLQRSPAWPERVACAAAWCRDCAEIDRLPADVERYRPISADTLLLWGTETQAHHRRAVEALASVLPHVAVVPIAGHGHAAVETAPREVAAAIRSFILGR